MEAGHHRLKLLRFRLGKGEAEFSLACAYFQPNYDRSIVAAPTRKLKVEKYIQSHNNDHKQRSTIFSTPTVLNAQNNYKGLESKKHYSNIYNSNSMQGVMDYRFGNTDNQHGAGKKHKENNHKNASSVGNPITFAGETKANTHESAHERGKKRGVFTQDMHTTTGNFKLENNQNQNGKFLQSQSLKWLVKEFVPKGKHPNNQWADQVARNPFRSNQRTIEGITQKLIQSASGAR